MWYQNLRRAAFHNLNEYDPRILDVEKWMQYWATLEPNVFVTSCAGLMAFYPTRLPGHPRSQFLGERDVFGEYFEAAKKRGMRVIARVETNWAQQQVLDAHPDWFERDAQGNPVPHEECSWIYHTCLFSSYYTSQVPGMMREVASLYDVDGFFTNSWPDAGKPRKCFCANCQRASGNAARVHERHQNRIVEICRLLQKTAGEKRPDRIYAIHIGSGIRSALSLKQLAELSPVLIADHQGRSGDTPIWDCAQQGRAAKACTGERPVLLGVGTSGGVWRHTAKGPAELTSWLAQAAASGMVPRYTWLGSAPNDQRWRPTGPAFFSWLARHEKHFVNRQPIARIGVVFSQRTNLLYQPPGQLPGGYDARRSDHRDTSGEASDSLQGLYFALLEGRFLFDFVHEESITTQLLDRYSALLLPNVAVLSDEQCTQIRDYVQRGGAVLATFETALFDEHGRKRTESGLSELFGVQPSTKGSARAEGFWYARIERQHELLRGLEGAHWLPGGEHRVPLRPVKNPVLSVVPPYPRGIPEMVYAHTRAEQPYPGSQSDEPAVVIGEYGRGRFIYFPGDIDRCAWQSGNTDLSRVLQNAIRFLTRDESPVRVTGDGMMEVIGWETEPGYAIHMLNYTTPHMTRPSIRQHEATGPQQVRFELPGVVQIRSVELLRAERTIPFQQRGSVVTFTVPAVHDYEVAALSRA